MNDLKEFWDKNNKVTKIFPKWCKTALQQEAFSWGIDDEFERTKHELGLFFWLRGGAEWYKEQYESTNFVKLEEYIYNANQEAPDVSNAQSFLDVLACLGEEKVKELIKELKK